MSSQPPLPACPRCGRRIAAWKKEHCVYCGAEFPSDLKQGFEEPEALKWIERPGIPPDAARKLEMMKVVPLEDRGRGRSAALLLGLISLPIMAVVFYLVATMLRQYSPAAAALVLAGGGGFLLYLLWTLLKSRRS
jgi:hypothetical protein